MDLSFIIVNWNTCQLLLTCIESILKTVHGYCYEIIVVDNGSEDESVPEIKRQFGKQITLIENRHNLGFARANNQALRIAQGRFIVLLNSDAVLKPSAINILLSFLAATPLAAMAGPRMVSSAGILQNSYDNFPSLATELLNKSLLRFFFSRKYAGKNSIATAPFEVDSLIGACLAVKRQAIQEVGMLDEGFFFFLEETDWCFRMRRAGWKIYHCPGAEIIHLQGQSKGRNPGRAGVEYYRSLYRFFRKNRSAASYYALRSLRCVKLFINVIGTCLVLGLSAGTHRKSRIKTKTYAYVLCWHLLGCPDSWGLEHNISTSNY